MSVPAETAVSDRSEDMVPSFGNIATVGANKIAIRIVTQERNGSSHLFLVVDVVRSHSGSEHMVDGSATACHHPIRLQVRGYALSSHICLTIAR